MYLHFLELFNPALKVETHEFPLVFNLRIEYRKTQNTHKDITAVTKNPKEKKRDPNLALRFHRSVSIIRGLNSIKSVKIKLREFQIK